MILVTDPTIPDVDEETAVVDSTDYNVVNTTTTEGYTRSSVQSISSISPTEMMNTKTGM